jgi:hypothetical protein
MKQSAHPAVASGTLVRLSGAPKGQQDNSPEVLCAEKGFFIEVIHTDLFGFTLRTQEPCLS